MDNFIDLQIYAPPRTGTSILRLLAAELIDDSVLSHHDLPEEHIRARDSHGAKTILCTRNARDLAVSIGNTILEDNMNKKYDTKEKITSLINNPHVTRSIDMVKRINALGETEHRGIFNYDEIYPDGLGDYRFVLNKLGKLLDLTIDENFITLVQEKYDMRKLKEDAANTSFDQTAPNFAINGHHISNTPEVGKWRHHVPEELHAYFEFKMKVYE